MVAAARGGYGGGADVCDRDERLVFGDRVIERHMKYATIFGLLLIATILEAGGDAIVRVGLNTGAIPTRILLMLIGGVTLFCYGLTLNLAPLDFGPLIGAYVATFFVVAQIINLVVFRTLPGLPILVGGLFILTGGAIITLWRR